MIHERREDGYIRYFHVFLHYSCNAGERIYPLFWHILHKIHEMREDGYIRYFQGIFALFIQCGWTDISVILAKNDLKSGKNPCKDGGGRIDLLFLNLP